ncbi:hypothetical protein M9458_058132 [Cirrhinus mrigala]|uniref:Uncharacterized protein n=1 Tax=Cirrhinus mrigala TaxID=683832 RepID=A0ABD0MCN7_CIRMR
MGQRHADPFAAFIEIKLKVRQAGVRDSIRNNRDNPKGESVDEQKSGQAADRVNNNPENKAIRQKAGGKESENNKQSRSNTDNPIHRGNAQKCRSSKQDFTENEGPEAAYKGWLIDGTWERNQ